MKKILIWAFYGILIVGWIGFGGVSVLQFFGIEHLPWKLSDGAEVIVFFLLLAGGIVAGVPSSQPKKDNNAHRT
jgi:hypothetical protein